MDLFADEKPGENAHDFTVSELSGAIKKMIEGEIGRVRVSKIEKKSRLNRRINVVFDEP